MNEVGKEYGTAIYMLASEEGRIKEYGEGLKLIAETFVAEPEYFNFLSSPSIPLKSRIESVSAVFSAGLPEKVLSFLQLLCEKGRINCFDMAVEAYNNLQKISEHILNVKIKSAVPLTDSEKSRLSQKLTKLHKCKIDAEYVIDEGLIGGIIIEADGKVTDGSIRHQLQEIKEVIEI